MEIILWPIALFFALYIPAVLLWPLLPWARKSGLRSDKTGFNSKEF